jgi:hypothetical protein
MKTTINAIILQRFSHLPFIKIEITNGRGYLIGTDETVACVEYLGEVNNADDSCYIKVDDKKIETEVNFGGTFTFETIPDLAMGSVTTTSGQDCSEFIIWPDESPLKNWKKWFTISNESHGFIYCDLMRLVTLWEISPSGEIVFPEVINSDEPVIIRDINDPNWIGVFMPVTDSRDIMKPATLPEWLNADNA